MPSTNVNVGLLEGRSSCRVLKPPGGGHSDIFGCGTTIAETSVRTTNSSQLTGIEACLYTTETKNCYNGGGTVANGAKDNVPADINSVVGANGKQREDVDGAIKQAAAEELKKATIAVVTAQSQRVRVPPGGFSSGFW